MYIPKIKKLKDLKADKAEIKKSSCKHERAGGNPKFDNIIKQNPPKKAILDALTPRNQ